MMIKECKECFLFKNIDEFQKKGKKYYSNKCKQCFNKIKRDKYKNLSNDDKEKLLSYNKKYRENNLPKISEQKKIYYTKNKSNILSYKKNYIKNNKEKILDICKKYRNNNKNKISISNRNCYLKNKDKIRKYYNNYHKNRLISDPEFKLRRNVSRLVSLALNNTNSSKLGLSVLKFLPYTMSDLKNHLEKQFESWMTWDNWGSYKKNIWKDEDQSTWTWQMDHVIPQSIFPYTSMQDDNFKKCWALENLRPLSAKQNLLKGNKMK